MKQQNKIFSNVLLILVLVAILFTPNSSFVEAGVEPNLNISYVWDPFHQIDMTDILDEGEYELPVNVGSHVQIQWEGSFFILRVALYKGELHKDPELLRQNNFRRPITSPGLANHTFPDFGKYFLVAYTNSEDREWIEHGSSTNPDAGPSGSWGLIEFEVVPRVERVPDWDISYSWNGVEIEDGGEYELPLNEFGVSHYEWEPRTEETKVSLFQGEYKEGAVELQHNSVFNSGGTNNSFSRNTSFPDYGNYFVSVFNGRIYNTGQAREWLANGTSTGLEGFPLYGYGLIQFKIVPPKEGNSNVAFIPGLQASRLYIQESDIFENRVWEPGSDSDGEKLFMTPTGVSQRDVYTRDIIDEGAGLANIYKSFIEKMDDMVADGDIAEWQALPYDWRHNVFDVAGGDIKLPDGETYRMIEEIERLAGSSDSGKVTIVTHSNGGLVAKALISELEAQDKADLVDKLVLVAVPQLGTPKAIASILHGDYQEKGFGLLLTAETARLLGKNMPGGYGLLPSAGYFDKISDPVIAFDDESSTTNFWRGAYGTTEISDVEILDSFMLGEEDGRADPERDDLLSPIVANDFLLSRARNNQVTLDNWTSPEEIEVTEIVGWGRDTLKGVEYKDKEVVTTCANFGLTCEKEIIMDHSPLFTVDGDRTVISYSAGHVSEREFYVDIGDYNATRIVNKKHSDILEITSVLEFLNSILKNEEITSLPQFITETKPSVSEAGESLRLSVHSPVSIGITDDSGNFTGVVNDSDLVEISEEIPNSLYLPFGDGKYVGVPVGNDYEVELLGENTGVFTLNIEKVSGDDTTDIESFVNIPVTAKTSAELSIDAGGDTSGLSLDVNGDGDGDVTLNAGDEFSSTDYLAVLRAMIENSDIAQDVKDSLFDRLDNIVKQLEKDKRGNSVDALLHSMIQTLQSEPEGDDIVTIIRILNIELDES